MIPEEPYVSRDFVVGTISEVEIYRSIAMFTRGDLLRYRNSCGGGDFVDFVGDGEKISLLFIPKMLPGPNKMLKKFTPEIPPRQHVH